MAKEKKPEQEKRVTRVPLLLTEAELKRLDDWRFANRMPTRSDAVREMMRRAYEAGEMESPSST